jgi:hypothetical protein
LSSTLLGSIIAGRGHEGMAGGWNLKAVAQVLSEDYSSRDWLSVPRHWDVPGFIMQDANQFRTLLDLYRAGANNTPSLSAFTVQWRNSAGQLSVLSRLLRFPSFYGPLNEEGLRMQRQHTAGSVVCTQSTVLGIDGNLTASLVSI